MLIPPEVMGAHIGPTRSHTTGRSHSLAFRALTAVFGHLGIEWNLLDLSDDERAALAEPLACVLHGIDACELALMNDDGEADQAINSLNNKDVSGRPLVVNEARERAPRPGGGGGGGGRGGYGGSRGGYGR